MSISRIFFFDFDDTLYSHKLGKIPEAVLKRLRGLDQTESLLVVATGRGPESADFICGALGFLPPVLALLNGQLIWERGVQVYERGITLPSINAIIGLASQHGFAYGGYNRYGEVVSEINERVHAVWSRFGCPVPRVVSAPEREAPLYQGHLYITKAERYLFSPLFNEYLTNWSDEFLMNLIPRSAGKASAVDWCLEHYPCPLAHTYAFGDGFNDVDLLGAVGHGVAVGGDNPELVAAAECTVPSAEEGGLLQAFDYYDI